MDKNFVMSKFVPSNGSLKRGTGARFCGFRRNGGQVQVPDPSGFDGKRRESGFPSNLLLVFIWPNILERSQFDGIRINASFPSNFVLVFFRKKCLMRREFDENRADLIFPSNFVFVSPREIVLKGHSMEKRGKKAAPNSREFDGNYCGNSFPSNSDHILENQAAHIMRRFDGNDLDRVFPSNFNLFLPNQTAQALEDEVRNYRVQQNPVYLSDSVELCGWQGDLRSVYS